MSYSEAQPDEAELSEPVQRWGPKGPIVAARRQAGACAQARGRGRCACVSEASGRQKRQLPRVSAAQSNLPKLLLQSLASKKHEILLLKLRKTSLPKLVWPTESCFFKLLRRLREDMAAHNCA